MLICLSPCWLTVLVGAAPNARQSDRYQVHVHSHATHFSLTMLGQITQATSIRSVSFHVNVFSWLG